MSRFVPQKLTDLPGTLPLNQGGTGATDLSGARTALGETWVTATDGATVTFDLSAGRSQKVTLGGNRTLAVSNAVAGQPFLLALIQDGTGSRTVTWFSGIKWAGGSAPTLTTTAAKADLIRFHPITSSTFYAEIVGQNY